MAVSRINEAGLNVTQYGNRNLMINGAMLIDQRNGGSATTPTSDQTVTLDRFKARLNVASKYSVQQVADAPSGFYNSLKVTSAAATTPGTNDYYQIATPLEGYTTNVLAQGTSAAKKYTLSFYVKSSLTGTFGGAYSNDLGNRFYAWTYTIDAANTWERKSITITGATDGTWLSANNAGLHVYWTLGTGSGVQTSAGVWGTSFKRGPTGATNVVATSGATWQVTGIQLEVGDTATDFEHRTFGDELQRCYRYFESKTFNTFIGVGYANIATTAHFPFPYLEKRSAPTVTLPTAGQGTNEISFLQSNGSYPSTTGSNTVLNATKNQARIQGGSYSGLTAEGPSALFVNGEASVTIDAEL